MRQTRPPSSPVILSALLVGGLVFALQGCGRTERSLEIEPDEAATGDATQGGVTTTGVGGGSSTARGVSSSSVDTAGASVGGAVSSVVSGSDSTADNTTTTGDAGGAAGAGACGAPLADRCEPVPRVMDIRRGDSTERWHLDYGGAARIERAWPEGDLPDDDFYYLYDDSGALSKITSLDWGYDNIQYHDSGKLKYYESSRYGARSKVSYDEGGRLVEKSWTPFELSWETSRYDYSFRADGQIESATITVTSDLTDDVRVSTVQYVYDDTGKPLRSETVNAEGEVTQTLLFDAQGSPVFSYQEDVVNADLAGESFFRVSLSDADGLSVGMWWEPLPTAERPFPYSPPALTPSDVANFSFSWRGAEFSVEYVFDPADRLNRAAFEWNDLSVVMTLDHCDAAVRKTITSDPAAADERVVDYYFGCASDPELPAECLVPCEP